MKLGAIGDACSRSPWFCQRGNVIASQQVSYVVPRYVFIILCLLHEAQGLMVGVFVILDASIRIVMTTVIKAGTECRAFKVPPRGSGERPLTFQGCLQVASINKTRSFWKCAIVNNRLPSWLGSLGECLFSDTALKDNGFLVVGGYLSFQ